MQIDALENVGCGRIFQEQASGAKADRPQLNLLRAHLRPGDTVVVWRLDRLGRSLRELVEIINELKDQGVGFRSLQESIDTTTPGGRLTFHLFASLAEFERDLIRERTAAGLSAARRQGRTGGRPSSMTPQKLEVARRMLTERGPDGLPAHTVTEIARTIGVSRSTVYRAVAPEQQRERPS